MVERKGWMRGEICFVSVKPMNIKPEIFSVGGFTAKTEDGKEFHFDWDDQYSGIDIVDGFAHFHTHLRNFNDEVYEEMNEENGVKQLDITPEFIKDSKLTEVFYECYMKGDDVDKIEGEKLELVLFNIYGEVNGESQDIFYPGNKIKEFNLVEAESIV